jgi:hypothetical protein
MRLGMPMRGALRCLLRQRMHVAVRNGAMSPYPMSMSMINELPFIVDTPSQALFKSTTSALTWRPYQDIQDLTQLCFALLQQLPPTSKGSSNADGDRINQALHYVQLFNDQASSSPAHHVGPHPNSPLQAHQDSMGHRPMLVAACRGVRLPTVTLANTFIEALLAEEAVEEAWGLLLNLGLHADALSFGLFCRHHLVRSEWDCVQHVLREMGKRTAIPLGMLAQSHLFTSGQLAQLRRLSNLSPPAHEDAERTELDPYHEPLIDDSLQMEEEHDNPPLIKKDHGDPLSLKDEHDEWSKTTVEDANDDEGAMIKSVKSRHGGIGFIRQSLQSVFHTPSPQASSASSDSLLMRIRWQRRIERDCLAATCRSLQHQWQQLAGTAKKISEEADARPAGSFVGHRWLVTTWARDLAQAIHALRPATDKDDPLMSASDNNRLLWTLLKPLSDEKLSLLTLLTLLSAQRYSFDYTYSSPAFVKATNARVTGRLWPATAFTPLCGDIGRAVEQELGAEQLLARPILRALHAQRQLSPRPSGLHQSDQDAEEESREGLFEQVKEPPFHEQFARQCTMQRLVRQRSREQLMREGHRLLDADATARQAGWTPKWTARTRFLIGSLLVDVALRTLCHHWDYLHNGAANGAPEVKVDDDIKGRDIVIKEEDIGTKGRDAVNEDEGSDRRRGTYAISRPFVHCIIGHQGRRLGIVAMDRRLYDQFYPRTFADNAASGNADNDNNIPSSSSIGWITPWALPMVCPPKPWTGVAVGGYLAHQFKCVRTLDDSTTSSLPLQDRLLQHADAAGHLRPVLEGLTYLGNTPWAINRRVLDVAVRLWNAGGNLLDFAPSESSSSYWDPKYDEYDFREREEFKSHQDYVAHVRRQRALLVDHQNGHSVRCDTNYKLEIAWAYKDVRSMYFPHNVDFRGRAYPIAPHFSHIGGDLSRALLHFGEARPLGPSGLQWLKVHLANMCGRDKLSFPERAAYVDAHRQLIEAVVQDPLGSDVSRVFWQKADEPWQCLAACFEMAEAWGHERLHGNAAGYCGRLPVQQDGSCNGLQHYAALGGDAWGAAQVNLLPSTRPQDIYNTVAQLVNRRLDDLVVSDAKTDVGERGKLARMIKDLTNGVGVSRKIVKTPVMTNVYGVTLYGAKSQIEANLQDGYGKDVLGEHRRAASLLLATLVFDSLRGLFTQATEIKSWLEHCARVVSSTPFASKEMRAGNGEKKEDARREENPMMWTTPLGFPVLQPYFQDKRVTLRTALQTISLRESDTTRVDSRRQVSGMAPNFVHSLDATHMFMTALRCREAGLTFASVHDCFWTHPGSVDTMARLLRQAFVDLHSLPILQNLRDELTERYYSTDHSPNHSPNSGQRPSSPLKEVPKRGKLDLRQVLTSDYFFS